jgi:hypothetical protein
MASVRESFTRDRRKFHDSRYRALAKVRSGEIARPRRAAMNNIQTPVLTLLICTMLLVLSLLRYAVTQLPV